MSNLKIDNFIKTSLGELVSKEKKSIISGPFGSNIGKVFFKSEGIPVIRGNNLSTGGEKFKDKGFVFITRDKANELNCYAIKNDLIFTAVGTIGQVGIIDEKLKFDEYVISNKQLRVRFDNSIITPLFAYYWFSSYWIQKLIVQRNVGSTVPLINLSILKGLPIILPKSIKVQNNITGILENISAKIELNNKINTELEAMAKTLYDYWFVQFDFPDVNGKPHKTSGGKMVWNEELKREIPEGWEVDNLLNVSNITTGKLDSNAEVLNGKYYFYTCSSIPTKTDSYAFDNSVILIAGNNAAGNFHVNRYTGKFNAYQRTYIVTANEKEFLDYLYQVLFRQMKVLKTRGNGSQTKFLTIGMLNSISVFKPNLNLMSEFSKLTIPMYEKQVNLMKENQQLSSLRDWLLPMLMNGQVRVGDVDVLRQAQDDILGMVAEGSGEKYNSKA